MIQGIFAVMLYVEVKTRGVKKVKLSPPVDSPEDTPNDEAAQPGMWCISAQHLGAIIVQAWHHSKDAFVHIETIITFSLCFSLVLQYLLCSCLSPLQVLAVHL